MLFLVYCLLKSASTFLANLARQACHAAGADPDTVKTRLFTGKLEKKRRFWNGPLFAVADIARQMHQSEHTVLNTPREAIDAMTKIVREDTIPWLKSGLGTAFNYDTLTRENEQVIGHLAELLGVEKEQPQAHPGVAKLIDGKTRVYNFNKSIADHHHDAFSAADLAYLQDRCAPFIRFCNGEKQPQ